MYRKVRIVTVYSVVAQAEHGPQMHGALLLVLLGVAVVGVLVYLGKRRLGRRRRR